MSLNPISESQRAFERKMKRAAIAIREASSGRTCGDCRHALLRGVHGFCALQVNTEGSDLAITSYAVACGGWSR